jgi:hypothetical protein
MDVFVCSNAFYPSIPLMNIKYEYLPIFLTVTFLWYSFPKIVRMYGSDPTELNKDYSPNYLLHLTPTIVFAKYFEIVWQQGLFIYVLFVALKGQSEIMKLVWFFALNILLHVANIIFLKKKETLFPVLEYSDGNYIRIFTPTWLYFLTANIHMLFYLIVNSSLWLKKT